MKSAQFVMLSSFNYHKFQGTSLPFKPNINIHILLTVLHIFLMVLVERIRLNLKTLYL